ncbi:MAG: hypothetical protein PWP04_1360 [Candidatus Atribacteria bacterium]|nr:hypothetical protein [Candidatus Atribacteria bacterium]
MFSIVLELPESLAFLTGEVKQKLEEQGCYVTVIHSEKPLDIDIKRSLLKTTNVYVIGSNEIVTDNDFEDAKLLRLVQCFGAGYENVNCQAASQKGIYVANIPGINANSVADLTMGLILALVRPIVKADTFLKKGMWCFWIGHELAGKTLGIFGLGAIGKAVALRAQAHKMGVIAYDIKPDLEFSKKQEIQLVSKTQLLEMADVITLHMPLTEETHNFISKSELDRIKPTAYIVNTSRGGLIDQTALVEKLRKKQIAGAALDVFTKEPLPSADEILSLDNVVLTPHIGGLTFEALERLAEVVVENSLRIKRGEPPLYMVN